MIGTIRKHSKWLWAVIITATIVSFVYFFTPGSGGGGYPGASENYGSIDGVRISKAEYVNAYRETLLVYFIATGGAWPDQDAARSGFDVERETYQRMFLLRKLKEYDIEVDSASAAQAANHILRQFGRGRALTFDDFVQQGLARHATAEDFQRYIHNQLALQQFVSVVGLSGDLVTPQDAQSLYVRDHQELSTEAVFFSASNYLAGVPAPSPETLVEYFTNRTAIYRVGERAQVNYVSFEATNFWAQAERELTNITQEVEMNFQRLGTNYFELAKTPEAAKEKIRELLLRQQAMATAYKKANAFATELFNIEPLRPENLAALAGSNGLTIKVSAPFEEMDGSKELGSGPAVGKQAFALTAEEPFAGPLKDEANEAFHVIGINRKIPSEFPTLAAIRDRVIADYRHDQALTLARQAGEDLARTLASVTNGLAQGKTFAAICANAKVKPVVVPPLSISGTNSSPEVETHINLDHYKQIAFSTSAGAASEFNPTLEGGLIVHVRQRLPVDEAKMKADMPAFLRSLHQARRQEALNAWLQREGSRSLRDTPIMQRKPEPPTPGRS